MNENTHIHTKHTCKTTSLLIVNTSVFETTTTKNILINNKLITIFYLDDLPAVLCLYINLSFALSLNAQNISSLRDIDAVFWMCAAVLLHSFAQIWQISFICSTQMYVEISKRHNRFWPFFNICGRFEWKWTPSNVCAFLNGWENLCDFIISYKFILVCCLLSCFEILEWSIECKHSAEIDKVTVVDFGKILLF